MKSDSRLLFYSVVMCASALVFSVHASDLQQAAQASAIVAKFADDVQRVQQANSQPLQATENTQQVQNQSDSGTLPEGAYKFDSDISGFGTEEFDNSTYQSYQQSQASIMTLGTIRIATCNEFPSGGTIKFPQDLTGVKTRFTAGEKITIVMFTERHARWGLKLWNENGEELGNYATPVGTVSTSIGRIYSSGLVPGKYTVGFYFVHLIGGKEDEDLVKKVNFAVAGDAPTQQVTASLPEGAYEAWDPHLGKVVMGIYNYCENFEGDNQVHMPNDFVGIKTHFSRKEKITIGASGQNASSSWGFKIWNGGGDLFVAYKMPSGCKPVTFFQCAISPGTTTTNSSTGDNYPMAAGNYTMAFYNGDSFIKKLSFEVTDN